MSVAVDESELSEPVKLAVPSPVVVATAEFTTAAVYVVYE